MARTADPALEFPVFSYTALQAVHTEKQTSMPTPAPRKRVRRPTRSTRKAQPRETSQHQMVRPPLMAAWLEALCFVSRGKGQWGWEVRTW
jgi:hypothetical protein